MLMMVLGLVMFMIIILSRNQGLLPALKVCWFMVMLMMLL